MSARTSSSALTTALAVLALLSSFGCQTATAASNTSSVTAAATTTTTAAVGKSKPKSALPTIFVAPFSTDSSPEYGWIGDGMALALTVRLHKSNQVNYLSLRQVAAAIKSDNIDKRMLHTPQIAARLGKLLGADYAVVSSYKAAWPNITFVVRIVDVAQAKVVQTFNRKGHLQDLPNLEADLARQLMQWKQLDRLPIKAGEFGTANLYAWRQLVLGQYILWSQSLSPAQPAMLPQEAVRTALSHFEQALMYDPAFAQAWADRAIAHALLGESKQALEAVGKALALSTADVPEVVLAAYYVHNRLALHSKSQTAVKKTPAQLKQTAERILADAVRLHPGFLHARGYLGELLQSQRRHKEAIAVFEAYLKQVPSQPWAMARIGYSYGKLKQYDKAIAITIKAVDLLPESPYLLLELASRYIDAGKMMGAENTLKNAIERFPQFSTSYVRLGFVYLQQNKFELAVPICERALILAQGIYQRSDRAYAHLNLTRAYSSKKDEKRALEHLKKAIDSGLTRFDQLTGDKRMQAFLAQPEVKQLLKSAKK